DLGDGDAEALAWSPHLGGLTTLLVWCNQVADAGLAQLAAGAANLPRLSRLDLSGNLVGDAGATSLAGSPLLARLTKPDLTGNQIGDAGALALAASPHTANLAWLDLAKNPITATGTNALRERFAARVHIWG